MNVFPIQPPPEGDGAKCPNCGTQIAADQRYCLACGQPCSPVRLPFLDVLQAESELRHPVAYAQPTAGYLPPLPADEGAIGWLRRYSGLFGLIAVLLMCGLIGLLVGHWLAPSRASGPSIVKIEGTLPAAATSAPSSTTSATTPASPTKAATSKSAPANEAQEVKEVKEAETAKAKPKPASKPSAATLQKLSSSKGKAHQQEIEKLTSGDKPIETGG
ncbi:MAG: zinc-ribbon domain-containing protein [Solirubrobacteraceae bacterium]